jgi:hypothetical protein
MGPRPAPLVCAEIHAAGSGIRENLSHFAKTIAFGILHDSFQLLLTNITCQMAPSPIRISKMLTFL